MDFKTNGFPICAYCDHFKLAEYYEGGVIVKQGICRNHEKLCEICDEICDDFVLLQGLHTNKVHPKNEDGLK